MSSPFTCIRRPAYFLFAAVLAALLPLRVPAQTLESVVMPGALSNKHAKLQADCNSCHVRFDRAAQPRVCLSCHDHRDVAADIAGGTGFHGRIRERECRVCHSEHKGADARLVLLDEKKFDHRLADFPLRGKHASTACASCHRPGARHRSAPGSCAGCHGKDDRHKGGLGTKCDGCHDERTWKEARFSHDRTAFPLTGRHRAVKCAQCHVEERYAKTPQACFACHRKDDEHKGKLGERCDKCHDTEKWKSTRFDHDRDTKFPLRMKHHEAECTSCHKTAGFRDRLSMQCSSCHESDDRMKGHQGRFGPRCQACHNERSWAAPTFDHDRDTRYALSGRHRQAKCTGCHRGALYRDKLESRCYACHERDDRHRSQLGTDCRSCHSERTWRETSFEHTRSRFPLTGRHASVECGKCHATPAYKDARAECVSCHAKDDAHKGRFVPRCESCHDAQTWKKSSFDHARTAFKLEGAHAKASCHACHKATVTDKVRLPSDCLSCHKDDDVHFNSYGPVCDKCHVAESWRKVDKRKLEVRR